MRINFLVGKPIAYIKPIDALVASDLHIGIESDLYKSGISIPSQVDSFLKVFFEAKKITEASKLIILGDVKHEVKHVSFRESKILPKFFSSLLFEFDEVHVCKGNHDGDIEKIIPNEIQIHGPEGFVMEKFGFFHGHAWPSKEMMKCNYVFMGHLQPAVEFKGIFGYRIVERVWLKGTMSSKKVKEKYKIKKIGKLNLIVIPSLNKFSGYFILNGQKKISGPLVRSKIIDLKKFEVYTLDGIFLGKVSSLKPRR